MLHLHLETAAYRGRVLLLAARTYAGQTTNLRTPGGGFAPVLVLPFGDAAQANDSSITVQKMLA